VAESGLPARIKAARQPCAKGRDVGTGEPHAALRELRFQIPVQRVGVGALARDVQLEAAPKKHAQATFERLNPWYYSDAPKTVQPMLDIIRRQSGFEEVQGGLDEGNALFEARGCLSCGNCFECDNCYGVCPDNAVIKRGPGQRYEFNYEYCKSCGLCAAECPCGAIAMVPETN